MLKMASHGNYIYDFAENLQKIEINLYVMVLNKCANLKKK